MSKTCRGLLCLAVAATFLAPSLSAANIKPMKSPSTTAIGGSFSPKSAHPTIRMESEEVIIRLNPVSYVVNAVFRMFNGGIATSESVGFPSHLRGLFLGFPKRSDFIHFETQVDGQMVQFSEERESNSLSYFLQGLSMLLPYGGSPRLFTEDRGWLAGKVAFPSRSLTTISVSYEAPYEDHGGGDEQALYIYGTGSHWKDTIEKAVFIIECAEQGGVGSINAEFAEADTRKHLIHKKVISDNLVRYEMRDWKPVPEGELSIVFNRQKEKNGGTNELMQAVSDGRLKRVQQLLKKGVDVNSKDRYGRTPLMMAVRDGRLQVTKFLLEKGADINAESKKGDSALSIVLAHVDTGGDGLEMANLEMAKIMKDHGANPTTFATAAFLGDMSAIRRFTESPMDASAQDRGSEPPPLKAAVIGGQLDAVKFLLKKGFSIEATNLRGRTPLITAAAAGHAELVKELLNAGAKVNAKDIHGRTALNHAADRGHVEVVKTLLEGGADINSRNLLGDINVLMQAALSGHLDVVKLLVERGADVNAKDRDGRTALDFAKGKDIEEIEKVLKDHGARE